MAALTTPKGNYQQQLKHKFTMLILFSVMIVTVTFNSGDYKHSLPSSLTSNIESMESNPFSLKTISAITGFNEILTVFNFINPSLAEPKIVASDKFEPLPPLQEVQPLNPDSPFKIPAGFESRVQFWVNIYSKYTSEDALFHDSQNLSIIYKVVDLRPLTQSNLHPYVIEHKVKKLIDKERKQLLSELESLKRKLSRQKSASKAINNINLQSLNLTPREEELFDLLSQPTVKSAVVNAIKNLRMQIGQKDFVEKALKSSDLYLPHMEEIFEQKGLPKELTRMPFVESSFNLEARSKVGASGIWQIMPATGKKLMPNDLVDYRNDPIKATEFAANLLKFNLRILDQWPLAITAYNHGPTGLKRLSLKYKTDDLAEIIDRAYGTHAFGFASSNFYACFLAILQVEKNRAHYFPETPRSTPLAFSTIQLKRGIKYQQLLNWFDKNKDAAEQFNPHLASTIKRGSASIPPGTYLYLPASVTDIYEKELPKLARRL